MLPDIINVSRYVLIHFTLTFSGANLSVRTSIRAACLEHRPTWPHGTTLTRPATRTDSLIAPFAGVLDNAIRARCLRDGCHLPALRN